MLHTRCLHAADGVSLYVGYGMTAPWFRDESDWGVDERNNHGCRSGRASVVTFLHERTNSCLPVFPVSPPQPNIVKKRDSWTLCASQTSQQLHRWLSYTDNAVFEGIHIGRRELRTWACFNYSSVTLWLGQLGQIGSGSSFISQKKGLLLNPTVLLFICVTKMDIHNYCKMRVVCWQTSCEKLQNQILSTDESRVVRFRQRPKPEAPCTWNKDGDHSSTSASVPGLHVSPLKAARQT